MIRQHKQKKRDEEIKKQQKGKTELKTSLLSLNVHKPWQQEKPSSNLQKYLSQKKTQDDNSDVPQKPAAENIIDSRITEKRPEANVTIEKRKLLNNNLVKGEDLEQMELMEMNSLSLLQPPFK